jgi:hypothetical protein
MLLERASFVGDIPGRTLFKYLQHGTVIMIRDKFGHSAESGSFVKACADEYTLLAQACQAITSSLRTFDGIKASAKSALTPFSKTVGVTLIFTVEYSNTQPGDELYIIGSFNTSDTDSLTPGCPYHLKTTEQTFPFWTTQFSCPIPRTAPSYLLKYKVLCKRASGAIEFESEGPTSERKYTIRPDFIHPARITFAFGTPSKPSR